MNRAARDHAVASAATKFGARRALVVVRHQELRVEFFARQKDLALIAGLQLLLWAITPGAVSWLFLSMFFVLATTGRDEARRMRACGRRHQCKRSLEVIGI